MTHRTYPPPVSLARFVDCFWVEDGGDGGDGTQPLRRQRELPNGTSELVINLSGGEGQRVYHQRTPTDGQSIPEALVRGAHSEWYQFEASPATAQVGVHFRSGGASPFFAPPAGELHNQHVPLEALWGVGAVAELRERLLGAPGPKAQIALLARALHAHAVRPLELHPVPAVAFALQAFASAPFPPDEDHARTMARVADWVGLSHSRFTQVFRDAVGLTPMRYGRVRRFLEVLRRTREGSHVAWAGLALACGYYDQAHLINDFRAFAGLCPTDYLRERDARDPTSALAGPPECTDLRLRDSPPGSASAVCPRGGPGTLSPEARVLLTQRVPEPGSCEAV